MKLRKWQKNAFPIWWKNKSGILKVVTGGGKTFFALYCIKKYLEAYPKKNILIVVPSIPLLDQWSIEIKNYFDHSVTLNGGGFKLDKLEKIAITTFGSLKNIFNKINTANTLLIVDECHKLGTPSKGEMLFSKWDATMGLSATPEREFDDFFREIISPILGEIIFNYDYKRAYSDNVISKFHLLNAYAPLDDEESDERDEVSYKIAKRIAYLGGMEKDDKVLKILFFQRARIVNEARNRVPAAIKLMSGYNNKKWLVFCETKNQASLMCSLLNESGYRAELYNTDISYKKRHTNMHLFRNDMLDVLVTCKALDEGFDLPNIDAVLIVSSSTTSRQRIQRMGRALRKTSKDKDAVIITIYSTSSEYDRLLKESLDFETKQIKTKWVELKI